MQSIVSRIEHTLLKPDATQADIEKLCQAAKQYDLFGVCVNPYWIKEAVSCLKGSPVKIVSVVGFPTGALQTSSKVFETERAVECGADEIDMVLNIGAFKDNQYEICRADIMSVVKFAAGKPVKVIIETGLLSYQEIPEAARLVEESGGQFVKTCTGFSKGNAEIEHIELIRKTVGSKVKIKASGGIRSRQQAEAFIAAGADRIGTSSGDSIARDI